MAGPVTDAGPAFTTVHGVAGVPFTSTDQHSAAASVTDAPPALKILVVDDLVYSVDTTMNVTFKEETSGTVIAGPFYVLANTTVHLRPRSKPWRTATSGKKLQVITSVSGNITVDLGYHYENTERNI